MKRDVYKLLAEKYTLVEQDNLAQYEWNREGLEVGGKSYDVYCNFEYNREAIDYQFDPRQDRGRDVYAMVPTQVTDIKVYESDPQGNGPEITDPNLLETIKNVALEIARDETIRDTEETQYGEYM